MCNVYGEAHFWEMVYAKYYFKLAKIFVLRLFKMATNQTEVCHQIFYGWKVQTMWNLQKKMCNVYREAYFSQKKVYKRAKNEFDTTSLSQKENVEAHWLLGNKKFRVHKLVTPYLSKAHSITDGTQLEKSSLPYQIDQTESGLMDQEGSHLGTTHFLRKCKLKPAPTPIPSATQTRTNNSHKQFSTLVPLSSNIFQ